MATQQQSFPRSNYEPIVDPDPAWGTSEPGGFREHADMPWPVGRDLGIFCGVAGCREDPAPWREVCYQHSAR